MAVIKRAKTQNDISNEQIRRFELDQASSDHIIDLLVSAYAKPQFSSLREVLQNALDANPNTKVEVTMPTSANPNLIVRDHGPGLSTEGFIKMIGSVGASDKRSDVTKAGCLGIGSLAPMSVAESMTMTSYQAGQMTVANIYKEDDGRLGYSVADPAPCKRIEPDGMEVTIPFPVDMHNALVEGLNVFKFSPAICSRLIVDESPFKPYHQVLQDSVKVGAHEVTFRVMEGTTGVLQGALVLLNNIPMAASFDRFPELKNFETYLSYRETSDNRRNPYAGTTLVIDVPAEAGLSFPPSREVIAATRLNAAFLSNSVARYFELGCKTLNEKGLHPGCEASVAMRWQQVAAEKRKDLRDVRASLEAELNKTSTYLRLELTTRYQYNKGEVPIVVLHPRLPGTAQFEQGPRSLEGRWIRMQRSGNVAYSMQTCGVIPISTVDSTLGFKHPWGASDRFFAVTWSRLAADFRNDWSRVMGRQLKFKQAMYELLLSGHAGGQYSDQNRVLLLVDPLPDDHPLRAVSTPIEFEDWIANLELSECNPYAKETEEEGEVLADGSVVSKGEKVRHPRTFVHKDGTTEKLGLPKAKPFLYLETLREYLTGTNTKGVQIQINQYSGAAAYSELIRFVEDAGLDEDIEAVCLIPSQIAGLKREKRRLIDHVKIIIENWVSTLTKEEQRWIPLKLFQVTLAHKNPRLEELMSKLAAHGAGTDHGALRELLRGWDPAPTDNAERFTNAYQKALIANDKFTSMFDCRLDPEDRLATAAERKTDNCGLPIGWMDKPARLFKLWILADTVLARFIRLVALRESVRSYSTMNLFDQKWFIGTHENSDAGILEIGMDAAYEIAKRLV